MRTSEPSITDRLRILFVFPALLLLPLPVGAQEQTDPATGPSTSDAPTDWSATDLQPSVRNGWQTGKQHINADNPTATKQYLRTLVGADRTAKKTVARLLLAVHHLNKGRLAPGQWRYTRGDLERAKTHFEKLRKQTDRDPMKKTTKSYLASMKRQRKEENPR